MGKSPRDSSRREGAVRTSPSNTRATGSDRVYNSTAAAPPNSRAYNKAERMHLLAPAKSCRPRFSASSRVMVRVTPEVAKVTAKP